MRSHTVTGGNGAKLHVTETGDTSSQALLFIHGFSQCGETWHRQRAPELEGNFRIVTVDLRGHGGSDKPSDAYGDSRLWAEDLHAVIQTLHLVNPVLVGWSYGGFVICDFLRYYGDHDISGINFVGSATKISQEIAPDVLGGDFLALLPGFFSNDVNESMRTLHDFIGLCSTTVVLDADLYRTLGYNACVPPSVRQSLLSRSIDNDDLLPKLRVPVLISQGERDRIVHPHVAREHAAMIPNAALSMYPEAGHAVFLDDTQRFNRELAVFARSAALTHSTSHVLS